MRLTFIALLLALAAAPLFGAQNAHTFETTTSNRVTLPYLLHVPSNYSGRQSWPVILYLHGGSVRGTDIEKLRAMGLPARLEKQKDFPFIVISPLLPKGEIWTDADALVALVDHVLGHYATDPKRVFITGHSMGGRGALYTAYRHPQRFAAVAALSAVSPINDWAAGLRGKRIFYLHGDKDAVAPPSEGADLVSALRAGGADVRYFSVDGDHYLLDIYDRDLIFDWFLAPPELEVNPALGKPFERKGVRGGIVVYDLRSKRYVTSDPVRALTQYPPASTFKIMNSLVAFETGAAKDENEFMKWDGVPKRVSAWNKDMNMREAMRVSAVWFYQELARRAGASRMQKMLDDAAYGNRSIGTKIDRFWLEGPLRISPVEQIEFLVKLYREELPFSARSMRLVKEIMPAEGPLRAKTGWTDEFDPGVGWYVGWVEANGTTYFFATNVDVRTNADAAARVPITKEVLGMVGVKVE